MLYEKYLFVEADECNPCCCGDPWSIWRTGHLQAGRGRLVTPVSRSQHSLQYKVTLNTHSQTRETRDSHERNCSPPGRAMRQPDWIKGMKGIITLKRSLSQLSQKPTVMELGGTQLLSLYLGSPCYLM